MKISSKGRYAVRVMSELAKNQGTLVSVSEISKKQDISIKYLEQICALLASAKLIESVRGPSGGYRLSINSKECSVADILQATGDLPKIAPCLENGNQCPRKSRCNSIGYWEELSGLIVNYLKSIKLTDLVT